MTKEEFLKRWTEHEADLLRYAARELGKSADDAQDVVQGAICELLDTRPYEWWYVDPAGPHPGTSLIALLKQSVKHQCMRGWTKKSRRAKASEKANLPGVDSKSLINQEEDDQEAGSIDIDRAPDPGEEDDARDLKLDVLMAMDSLDPEDRDLMQMYFYKGMTEQEIADEKGWTHRKVECERRRIQRLLKGQLEAYGPQRTDKLRSQQAS
jgi:RNA polymerase sigma factor (sigma-70 family)